MFEPRVVGIYYMAQQVASLPQKLKTSFDPILGPVITQSLANGDMGAIARTGAAGRLLDHGGARVPGADGSIPAKA